MPNFPWMTQSIHSRLWPLIVWVQSRMKLDQWLFTENQNIFDVLGIDSNFPGMDAQVRSWSIAISHNHDLPLTLTYQVWRLQLGHSDSFVHWLLCWNMARSLDHIWRHFQSGHSAPWVSTPNLTTKSVLFHTEQASWQRLQSELHLLPWKTHNSQTVFTSMLCPHCMKRSIKLQPFLAVFSFWERLQSTSTTTLFDTKNSRKGTECLLMVQVVRTVPPEFLCRPELAFQKWLGFHGSAWLIQRHRTPFQDVSGHNSLGFAKFSRHWPRFAVETEGKNNLEVFTKLVPRHFP